MNSKETGAVILLLSLSSILFYFFGAATGHTFLDFMTSSPWLRISMVFILFGFLISIITFGVWLIEGIEKSPPSSGDEY